MEGVAEREIFGCPGFSGTRDFWDTYSHDRTILHIIYIWLISKEWSMEGLEKKQFDHHLSYFKVKLTEIHKRFHLFSIQFAAFLVLK